MKIHEWITLVGIAFVIGTAIIGVSEWRPIPVEPITPEPIYPMGDVNMDTCVTSLDVDMAMDMALGIIVPTQQQKTLADINKDGRINSADVSLIQGRIGICS